MVNHRHLGSRPGRGWYRARPPAGTSRRRLRRLVARVVLAVLVSVGALLGGAPAGAGAGAVGSAPSSFRAAVEAPSVVGPRVAGGVQPRTSVVAPTPDRVAPAAEIVTPGWLSRLDKPVMVIGLLIVVASIVSILRDI